MLRSGAIFIRNLAPSVKRYRTKGFLKHTILVRKPFLYGSIITTGLITWCTCQDVAGTTNLELGDSSLKKLQKRLNEQYNERILHSSVLRFGRAAVAIVSVFVDYKYSLKGLDADSENYKTSKSECHLRSAVKFRNLCSSNGGVFMKVGQHIGSLEFLFPKEYTDTLKCFQYGAPESSLEDVYYVIEVETNQKISDLFHSFEERPLGAASLAQVHKAVLKDGEIVAIKVQHKTVKQHAFADAKVIEFFANVASRLFPEFQFQWLVDQIKANLPLELNFLNEGKNCERMGKVLREFEHIKKPEYVHIIQNYDFQAKYGILRVPKIIWKPSTERVLFMEYCAGGMVDDLEYIRRNNINVNEVSTALGRLYSEMIFVHGYIHCDPHPGNILVRKNENDGKTEVILLDHGLYQTMKDNVRLDYCKLWQSMIERDIEGIKQYSSALGVGNYYGLFACIVTGRSWNSVQSGIDKSSMSKNELTEIQENALKYVAQITEILELLPREMILIFKTNDLLRGLDTRLKTKETSGSFLTMSKCCLRAVYRDELGKCDSRLSKLRLHCNYAKNRARLLLYQLTLTPVGIIFMNTISTFRRRLSYLAALITG